MPSSREIHAKSRSDAQDHRDRRTGDREDQDRDTYKYSDGEDEDRCDRDDHLEAQDRQDLRSQEHCDRENSDRHYPEDQDRRDREDLVHCDREAHDHHDLESQQRRDREDKVQFDSKAHVNRVRMTQLVHDPKTDNHSDRGVQDCLDRDNKDHRDWAQELTGVKVEIQADSNDQHRFAQDQSQRTDPEQDDLAIQLRIQRVLEKRKPKDKSDQLEEVREQAIRERREIKERRKRKAQEQRERVCREQRERKSRERRLREADDQGERESRIQILRMDRGELEREE